MMLPVCFAARHFGSAARASTKVQSPLALVSTATKASPPSSSSSIPSPPTLSAILGAPTLPSLSRPTMRPFSAARTRIMQPTLSAARRLKLSLELTKPTTLPSPRPQACGQQQQQQQQQQYRLYQGQQQQQQEHEQHPLIITFPATQLRSFISSSSPSTFLFRWIEDILEQGEDVRCDYFDQMTEKFGYELIHDQNRMVREAAIRIHHPLCIMQAPQTGPGVPGVGTIATWMTKIETRLSNIGKSSMRFHHQVFGASKDAHVFDDPSKQQPRQEWSLLATLDVTTISVLPTMNYKDPENPKAIFDIVPVHFKDNIMGEMVKNTSPPKESRIAWLDATQLIELRNLTEVEKIETEKDERTDGTRTKTDPISSTTVSKPSVFTFPIQARESDKDNYGHVTNSRVAGLLFDCFQAGLRADFYDNNNVNHDKSHQSIKTDFKSCEKEKLGREEWMEKLSKTTIHEIYISFEKELHIEAPALECRSWAPKIDAENLAENHKMAMVSIGSKDSEASLDWKRASWIKIWYQQKK